jgi:hypothetical protein
VHACIEALTKRRDWLAARVEDAPPGTRSYDVRERIALSYAIAVLEAAIELELIEGLEQHGVDTGSIHPTWIEE